MKNFEAKPKATKGKDDNVIESNYDVDFRDGSRRLPTILLCLHTGCILFAKLVPGVIHDALHCEFIHV